MSQANYRTYCCGKDDPCIKINAIEAESNISSAPVIPNNRTKDLLMFRQEMRTQTKFGPFIIINSISATSVSGVGNA